MNLQDFAEKIQQLRAKMILEGRDPTCILVYVGRRGAQMEIEKVETEDDGSGCNNLDVYLKG